VVIWDFGLFIFHRGNTVWAVLSVLLFALPLALQATPWVMTRVYALWFGVFLVVQSLLAPFLKSDYVTLQPNLRSTVDVRTAEAPGMRSGLRHITTDAKGFRVFPPVDYARKQGVRIFAIGGSTTEDAMVDDGSTWTHLVQEGLRSRHISAEVINTGVAGLRARNHLATLKVVLGYHPDLVLFLVGANDWNKHIRDEFERSYLSFRPPVLRNSPFGQVLERFIVAPVELRVRRDSNSGQHLVIGPSEAVGGAKGRSYERAVHYVFRPTEVSVGYREDMEEISRTCRASGVRCMFLTQLHAYSAAAPEELQRLYWMTPPYVDYTLDLESMVHIANVYNQFLVEFAKRNGHPLCDVASGMPPSTQFFYDDMHLTDDGAARVADLVFQCVEQALAN
jgi:lysophospholipase L1-like esterase